HAVAMGTRSLRISPWLNSGTHAVRKTQRASATPPAISRNLGMQDVWNMAVIPLLVRRGGCAVNKKSRSYLIPRRRGGRSQAPFQNAFRSQTCERPPRPLHQRRLRGIFLMSRPPLLTRRGIASELVGHFHCGAGA